MHIHTKVCAELARVTCSGEFRGEYFLSAVFPCIPKVVAVLVCIPVRVSMFLPGRHQNSCPVWSSKCLNVIFLSLWVEPDSWHVQRAKRWGFGSYLLFRLTTTPASQLSSTCARRTAFTRPVPARTATKKWLTNRMECSAVRSVTKSFPTSNTALSSL